MAITTSMLDQGDFIASVTVSADHSRTHLAEDVARAIEHAERAVAATPRRDLAVQVWVEAAQDGDDELLHSVAQPYRDLLQLRCQLPVAPSGITTRSFRFPADADTFIAVNNRAFSWHPEQSGFTRERLAEAMAEPWFNADGFRILQLEGRMAGFCWTKIHADTSPVVGEIYVIAVDPDFHGRGLGGPMTVAGLEWLSAEGIDAAILYVEADNDAALATYDRIGFTRHATNRAYSTSAP